MKEVLIQFIVYKYDIVKINLNGEKNMSMDQAFLIDSKYHTGNLYLTIKQLSVNHRIRLSHFTIKKKQCSTKDATMNTMQCVLTQFKIHKYINRCSVIKGKLTIKINEQ